MHKLTTTAIAQPSYIDQTLASLWAWSEAPPTLAMSCDQSPPPSRKNRLGMLGPKYTLVLVAMAWDFISSR